MAKIKIEGDMGKGYAKKAQVKHDKVTAALQAPMPQEVSIPKKLYVKKIADPLPQGTDVTAVIAYANRAIPILRDIEHKKATESGFNISAGIHTVFSGFNGVMTKQFKLDYLQITEILSNAGFGFKPVKRGYRVYLPEDAKNIQQHASDSKVNSLIDLIG